MKKVLIVVGVLVLTGMILVGVVWWYSRTSNPWNAATIGDISTPVGITIICKEGEDHITDISFTAERNYTPIFTEAFSAQEKPLSVHLIREKDILSENATKSGAEQILSNLTELIRNSLKMRARVFTQEELDLKSQIKDFPIIEKFQEIIGYEFDWSKFRNRREFKEYFWNLINK